MHPTGRRQVPRGTCHSPSPTKTFPIGTRVCCFMQQVRPEEEQLRASNIRTASRASFRFRLEYPEHAEVNICSKEQAKCWLHLVRMVMLPSYTTINNPWYAGLANALLGGTSWTRRCVHHAASGTRNSSSCLEEMEDSMPHVVANIGYMARLMIHGQLT